MLAAVFSVPLGHDVSHAEPIRVSLAQAKKLPAAEGLADGRRPLALPESQRRASAAPTLPDESRLTDLLDLRLQPTPLVAPAQPGQRLGHGDAVLVAADRGVVAAAHRRARRLREPPARRKLAGGGTPTVGVGVRF